MFHQLEMHVHQMMYMQICAIKFNLLTYLLRLLLAHSANVIILTCVVVRFKIFRCDCYSPPRSLHPGQLLLSAPPSVQLRHCDDKRIRDVSELN